jgi:hypothetical protein
VPAMGLGLAPVPEAGTSARAIDHMPYATFLALRWLGSSTSQGVQAGAPISGSTSSKASRRCSLPLSALLRGIADELWSQEVIDGLSRSLLR